MAARQYPPPIKRLASRIERRGPDDCWPWTGSVSHNGYGRMYACGRSHNATRLLWSLVHGDIPQGFLICHHCDNPSCMNLRHLYLGTPADNMRDRTARGRTKGPKGERNHSAKLTEDDVRLMRQMRNKGASLTEIMQRFNITACPASMAYRGLTWRHVQ
jgi:hypothetical protein